MAPVLRPPATRRAVAPDRGDRQRLCVGADFCSAWSSRHVEVGRARYPGRPFAGCDRGRDRGDPAAPPALTDRAEAALAAINTAAAPAPTPLSMLTTTRPVEHDWSMVPSAASPAPPRP